MAKELLSVIVSLNAQRFIMLHLFHDLFSETVNYFAYYLIYKLIMS